MKLKKFSLIGCAIGVSLGGIMNAGNPFCYIFVSMGVFFGCVAYCLE